MDVSLCAAYFTSSRRNVQSVEKEIRERRLWGLVEEVRALYNGGEMIAMSMRR